LEKTFNWFFLKRLELLHVGFILRAGIDVARKSFLERSEQFNNVPLMEGNKMATVKSAAEQKLDFMKLMVTELQYQNPLEPLDNQQMAAQLAQFTQLELSEKMNNNLETINDTISKMNLGFTGAMLMAEIEYARSLLGHTVSFYNETYQQTLEGSVKGIRFVDGEPVLQVEAKNPANGSALETLTVSLDEINSIQ